MNFKNKTSIVTGGGNGLGRELVLNLLARDYRVIAVDINASALNETRDLAGSNSGKLHTAVLDITSRENVEDFAKQAIADHGRIDGIINNAGIIQPFIKIADLEYRVIDNVFDVDFFGTLYMTKAFLKHFQQSPEASLVNVSSMGGLFPVPGQGIYGAAKSAVKLLTESLQAELADSNVHVTLVCPGGIATDIKFNSGAETNKMSEQDIRKSIIKPVKPSRAAQLIIEAMESRRQLVLIGNDIRLLNLIHKVSPSFARKLIQNQMKSHLRS